MVRVAVAGGSGAVGRSLVTALAEKGEHEAFVLTRKRKSLFEDLYRVELGETTYEEKQLIELFRGSKIHTEISVLDPTSSEIIETEKKLIRAATKSHAVERFVPTQFAIDYDVDDEHLLLSWIAGRQDIAKVLREQDVFEYTFFVNGYFMDYFGATQAPMNLSHKAPFVDIPAKKASIPGSGDVKVTFTHTADLGNFVAKAVKSTEKWPEKSVVIGDKATFNEIVAIGEKTQVKFDVTYNSIDDLRNGKIADIPAWAPMYERSSKEEVLKLFLGFWHFNGSW